MYSTRALGNAMVKEGPAYFRMLIIEEIPPYCAITPVSSQVARETTERAFLGYEVITEGDMRQRVRERRASERNRLKLNYRPLQRLGSRAAIATLAGILGNKGLRTMETSDREGDGPECRWCGKAMENTVHILNEYEVWKRKWPEVAQIYRHLLNQKGKETNWWN
ncbi:hypothetical protein BDZ91DRAFT_768023 [Kalaharituber pfeilii]|nr:hypothetical protein BDZ91DRAFT_768023 [Kalaharituber pfeilii]